MALNTASPRPCRVQPAFEPVHFWEGWLANSIPKIQEKHMKNRALFVSTFGLSLLSGQLWAGRPEAFSKIDAPGAVVTVASGINNDGYIAGWYCIQTPCSVSTTNTRESNPR